LDNHLLAIIRALRKSLTLRVEDSYI
jgi:hypothetical protein